MTYMPDMLETETSKSFDAFMMYCRLGAQNRSINNLSLLRIDNAIDNGDNRTTLAQWSTNNNWVQRAQQYDIEKQKEIEQSIRDRKLSLLDKLGAILEQALDNVDITSPSLGQAVTGVRAYVQSALDVLNELPTNRTLTGTVDLNASFEDMVKLYEQHGNIIDG